MTAHQNIHLDDLLTLDEACAWLRMNRRDLSERSRGRNPMIPAIRITQKTVRFHPRTILAKFAKEAGVAVEVIAAAFNPRPKEQPVMHLHD